jgi:hypothetical protein
VICKDGQTTVTQDIPMANHKITGLANGTASTDAMAYGQRPGAATGNGTTFLGANVNLNNTANFFNGPNTGAIGASGEVWLIIGVANISDANGAAQTEAALFDGTSYIANSQMQVDAATREVTITIVAVVTLSGATTFTLRAKDQSSTSGLLQTTGAATAVTNKATSITAVRIA